MELKVFLAELVMSLARLDFVASLELRTEVFTVKGRVHLMQRGFWKSTSTSGRRQSPWPGSRQNGAGGGLIGTICLRGWHRHPLENPEDHQAIAAMSIHEIIKELGEVWRQDICQITQEMLTRYATWRSPALGCEGRKSRAEGIAC